MSERSDSSGTVPMATGWLSRLLHSRALRAIGLMSAATGAGQFAILAALPLLTRLYSPAEFGLYALFSAFVGVASVGACLCLDLAIVQSRSEREADELCEACILSLPLTVTLSGVLLAGLIAVGAFGYASLPWRGVPLAMALVALNGIYVASRYRQLREQRYGLLARVTLMQSVGRALAPLAWFLLLPNWIGLALGELTGRSLGVRGLTRSLGLFAAGHGFVVRVRKWWHVVRREKQYTTLLLGTVLVDACASLLISPLLAGYYGAGAAGEYFLVASMLVAPSALIGTAAADVLHARGARLLHESPGRLPFYLARAAGLLLLAGCAIYGPVYLLAPYVFPMLFGEKWTYIAQIAQAMTPFMIVAFAASPCSRLLLVLNRSELKVISDSVRLIGTPLVLWATHRMGLPIMPAVWSLMWFLAFAYALYLALTFFAAHQAQNDPHHAN